MKKLRMTLATSMLLFLTAIVLQSFLTIGMTKLGIRSS